MSGDSKVADDLMRRQSEALDRMGADKTKRIEDGDAMYVSPDVFRDMVTSGIIDKDGRQIPPHARVGETANAKKGRQRAQRKARKANRKR